MKTNPLFFLFLLSSLLHSQDQSGLAPEVADLNAEDVSYENEKNLRYLEKPFFSTFPRNKSDQIPVGKFGADGGDKEKFWPMLVHLENHRTMKSQEMQTVC